MTRKSVQVLVAIVVGLVLLLLVLDRGGNDFSTGRTQLLPGFASMANDAERITIRRSGDGASVTIRRADGQWVVSERDDYPADVSQLRQLVNALAEARIVEEKTSNPDNYARLGVDDPGKGGGGTLVTVDGVDSSASVIVGDTAQGSFRYARVPEQATSYLIDRNPELPDSPGDWLRKDIVDIPMSRVRRVSIAHADGETVTIEKTDETQTDFIVLGIPDGRELSYATVGNGIAGALAGLQLDDVRKRIDVASTSTAVFETWDGLTLSIDVVAGDEATWLSFAASDADVDTESDEADDKQATDPHDAQNINEQLAGWQFQVADYKKNLLVRRWDDLLRD